MLKTYETTLTLVYDDSHNLKFEDLLINYIYEIFGAKIGLSFELMI